MFNTKYVMSKGLAFAENEEMEMLSLYAKEGWILYKFGLFGYKLKKAKPEKLQYSLDYRNNADEEYFSYFKEAGWNHVCSVGNNTHIFSAPEGTNPIYTDSDAELEKYISQYKLSKQLAIPSLLCSILCIILVSLGKGNYISDIYRKIFGIILFPTSIITVFSGLPCISYYFKIKDPKRNSNLNKNRFKGSTTQNKTYNIINELISKLATIMIIILITLFLLNIFNIINISKIVLYSIWLISILLILFSCFMPCKR